MPARDLRPLRSITEALERHPSPLQCRCSSVPAPAPPAASLSNRPAGNHPLRATAWMHLEILAAMYRVVPELFGCVPQAALRSEDSDAWSVQAVAGGQMPVPPWLAPTEGLTETTRSAKTPPRF